MAKLKNESKYSRLYKAFFNISEIKNPKDIVRLSEREFLKLCQIEGCQGEFKSPLFQNILPTLPKSELEFFHQFKINLNYKEISLGYLIFISSKEINVSKQKFLTECAGFISSSIYWIQRQRKLEAEKNEWDLIFDSFDETLCITDHKFQMLRTNQKFRDLTGKQKKEIYGSNLFSSLPISYSPPKGFSKPSTWISNGTHESKPISLEFITQPLVLKNPDLTFYLFIIKDVTKESLMKKQIASQSDIKEIGFIKGSIAHELNNPVTGIKSLLSVIKKTDIPKNYESTLEEMLEAICRCETIIKNLLSASSEESQPYEQIAS